MPPRILVVSYHAANPLTPRGARTQAVVGALARRADVHVVGGRPAIGPRTWWHRLRDRGLSEVGSRWLMDAFEPWSWRTLGDRSVEADGALLIGYPFSPLIVAARALRQQGVPYVVDMSDPWALTRRDHSPRTMRDRRSAAAERRLWAGANAGIVTTAAQARDLVGSVPGLDLLVRPNGYTDVGEVPEPVARQASDELRIGHFGDLYAPRLDITAFMRNLAKFDGWRRVVFHQYGRDEQGVLEKISDVVRVESRDPVPWPEVVQRRAAELDVALVVGNRDTRQLPSKAIEYLTLPVPRLALTGGMDSDALADYVDGKPGWLTLSVDNPDPGTRIMEHVRRAWTLEDLAPPRDESWSRVAEQLASFLLLRLETRAA